VPSTLSPDEIHDIRSTQASETQSVGILDPREKTLRYLDPEPNRPWSEAALVEEVLAESLEQSLDRRGRDRRIGDGNHAEAAQVVDERCQGALGILRDVAIALPAPAKPLQLPWRQLP
jgi:hypothetical protein